MNGQGCPPSNASLILLIYLPAMAPREPAQPPRIVPLFGHAALQTQLADSAARGALPASLLLHGPRGIGKQRLAIWLGQLLLCEKPEGAPCGACTQCRFSARLTHPDLHWFFPRPRPKDGDPSPDEVKADQAEAVAERAAAHGLYSAPAGDEGIFVATVRAIVHSAVMSPAIARRKVYVVGDAERMVSQLGADQAANAFLKLLEEPPADTFIILTSSEPGALLPTIRSRVVAVRVVPLLPAEIRAFLADPGVAPIVRKEHGALNESQLLALAAGAPGRILGRGALAAAAAGARAILDAAVSGADARIFRAAFVQGTSKARGRFSDTLDVLTTLLHERAKAHAGRDDRAARGAAAAIDAVERAKEFAEGNGNPQLITATLLREISPLVS
jgi:DNA polymerase-3 subunit delta'